ncbi:hypothetical protein [Pseudorhodoferax sp.]|uniref:hypothetical protein n=1 Tax=Pseudorhodoferax sp. TaxID=1993553 RepID=UPI0039E426D1
MNPPNELIFLIDRAKEIAGSDYKLARLLGITGQKLSDLRHGRKNAQPEDYALFASVAGLDPVAEMTRAMLRKHEGTKKGDLLMRALGKSSLAIGAAIASAGAHASAIFSTPAHDLAAWMLTALSTMYIM